ncbi:MAG: hypothetical protein KDH17_05675 [Rhodocyclaceae bacterium]|nr:hypothetical protein [Rhodocyclaceae bacterium]
MSTAAQPRAGAIQKTLLQPSRFAVFLAVGAVVLSLGFLAYTAAQSSQRLDPLERHMSHLRDLQQVNIDIQELLIHHFRSATDPDPAQVDRISAALDALVRRGAQLHPQTPANLRQAKSFLDDSRVDAKTGLLAALAIIRRTLDQENRLQHEVVVASRRAADVETAVAISAMVLTPLLALGLMIGVQRRGFRSIDRLSRLLENVGNLDFSAVAPVPSDDPLADVYKRYNDMAARLRAASSEAEAHASALESQVRAASETLLRQQAELENGARLAAVGEFAARLAHELRNPISGISAALHNMEEELPPGDEQDRVRLIADEMERVTGLLNRMLEQGRAHLETPVQVDTRQLVDDIVRLLRYQVPDPIEIRARVDDTTCMLPRDTLRQVLINLLRNASEAIGDAPGVISIDIERAGDQLTLTVADNGPGYPEALLSRGIRPFQTSKADGTGLGMSIIQRLVRSAGGEIHLGRSRDGGARTVVTLPCGD